MTMFARCPNSLRYARPSFAKRDSCVLRSIVIFKCVFNRFRAKRKMTTGIWAEIDIVTLIK